MPLTRRAVMLGLLAAARPAGAGASAGSDPIEAVRRYESATGGHVGFWGRNLRSGRTIGWRAAERFAMCSSFKMSLAALVLQRVDRGEDRLDAPIRLAAADVPDWYAPVARANLPRGTMSVGEMCRAAVEKSDNSCATLLLARVGGPASVTAFWRAIGDEVSRLDHGEPVLNRVPPGGVQDTTTPEAMATTIGRLVLGDVLLPPSRAQLRRWLVDCTTGLNRLRAGLPPRWIAGDKTGNNGADAAGDVLIAWPPGDAGPIVLAAYTRGGRPDPAALGAVFAGIGREAAARLG